jgi:aminoglycoside phosphotransferase (APT) family kinase protein
MAITFWAYYETDAAPIAPPQYADALARLHAGMRQIDVKAPHFTDRVTEARAILADRARSPDLNDVDRHLLVNTLQQMTAAITKRGAPEQLLHGEPHSGNVLNTAAGPLFTDFETCCRGPVEFDLAHAPEDVAEHYPGVDQALLAECRILMLGMIIAWRWERDDELPDGRRLGAEWLAQMRKALDDRESCT